MGIMFQSPIVLTSSHANDTGFVRLARKLDEEHGAHASALIFAACLLGTGLISFTAGYLRSRLHRAEMAQEQAEHMAQAATVLARNLRDSPDDSMD